LITYVSNCLVPVCFFVLISLFVNHILIIGSFLAKPADVACDKVCIPYSPTLGSHYLCHEVMVPTRYVEKNVVFVTHYALELNKWNPRKL
jgi:hypothetical protein